MIFLTILAVIIIFSVLVLIHEYGHFAMAKRAGIKVLEFGIGFPPRLFSKKIGETEYTINAIPFGGFVKLYGEDASDPRILKSKRSFAAQTPWVRTKVVVAGVVMNLLLAVALLTIGFTFGIEPLLVTQDDIFTHIQSGVVETASGIYIKSVDERVSGISENDRIVAINNKPLVDVSQLAALRDGTADRDVDVTIEAASGRRTVHLALLDEDSLGIELKPATLFPRLIVHELKESTGVMSAASVLKPGDVIIAVGEKNIFFPEDFQEELANAVQPLPVRILRNDVEMNLTLPFSDVKRVVVADVFVGSVAEKNGFVRGDIIATINGQTVDRPEDAQRMISEKAGEDISYGLIRNEEELAITTKSDKNNRLGIALSLLDSYKNHEISFYRSSVLTSLIKVGKVRYRLDRALMQSISESVRLSGLTIKAFGRTFSSLLSKLTVPDDVGGPVQIAYYTHTFLKEGFFAVLRFMALLSLSLAVINILPIPALDGGRFLFILIEVIFRRRVNARLEGIVHGIGFLLLIGLIVLVTYSDIVKLL